MNKERLMKLAKRLSRVKPENFTMTTWCGTCCCIAGHAMIMAKRPRPVQGDRLLWINDILPWAGSYLGLSERIASELMDIRDGSDKATPKQAAGVIRHLIKTGAVEWEKFV